MNNLEFFNVRELITSEIEETNGGCFFHRLWVSLKEGFIDGFNDGSGANCS